MGNIKIISITAVIALVIGYAAGVKRASTPQVTEKAKEIEATKTDTDVHIVVTTTTEKSPDGAEKTVIVSDTQKGIRKLSGEASVSSIITTPSGSKNHFSLLAGHEPGSALPDYGASFSRDILGPLNVGVYVFKSGEYGVSLGISF